MNSEQLKHKLELEKQEIEKYKWIESEKAKKDLGLNACLEWIRKYAKDWNKWYDNNYNK